MSRGFRIYFRNSFTKPRCPFRPYYYIVFTKPRSGFANTLYPVPQGERQRFVWLIHPIVSIILSLLAFPLQRACAFLIYARRVVSRPSPSRRLPHHIQAHSIIFTPPPLFRYSLCIPSHERLRLIYSPARASLIPLTLGLRDYFWIFHILSTPPPFVLVSGYILSTVISKLIPNQNRAI